MAAPARMVVAATLVFALGCAGPASAPDPVDADLEEMDAYGCGFGFWLGSAGGDVAVRLAVVDEEAAARGDIPREVELPHDAWEARLVLGRDLYANWCDDVLEPDEPEPVVDEEWPITAGAITLAGPAPEQGCPGELTATLEGLEATAADGTVVDLGGREVTNPHWGCFAG